MYELLLVSQSPRRRQILEEFGYVFQTDSVKVSEIIEENVNLADAIARVAWTKADHYLSSNKHLKSLNILILSADTVVTIDNEVLGKPKNSTEARSHLLRLSGKTHSVISGFCLLNLKTGEELCGFDTTKVEFRELTDQEITDYIQTTEPMDKAGAYAIQGEGRKFVKNFAGSIYNVIGLPIEKIEKVLREKNWDVARKSN